MTMWWLSACCCHFSHDFLMLFSLGSPPRNVTQMPNAFMDVSFPTLTISLSNYAFFFSSPPLAYSPITTPLFLPSLFLFTLNLIHPHFSFVPTSLFSIFVFFCFCLSPPAGVVPDHGSGDYDPVFTAGCLLRLCFPGNCLLCLHHSGGALCAQGAPTHYWHPEKLLQTLRGALGLL